MDRFAAELSRCGLTLEAGARTLYQNGEYILLVIAQDEEAIDEKNMNYDTKKALTELTKKCEAMPKVRTLAELEFPAHCVCAKPSHFIMQSPPEWEGSPVRCGDCGKSVPLYRLDGFAADRNFDDLLLWRRLRRGCFSTYEYGSRKQSVASAQALSEPAAAYAALKSCVSGVSLEGRRLAAMVEKNTGVITVYPLFSQYEKMPEYCPQCGRSWINPFTDAVKFKCFCRECRLVM